MHSGIAEPDRICHVGDRQVNRAGPTAVVGWSRCRARDASIAEP